jgi:hypothetical protein
MKAGVSQMFGRAVHFQICTNVSAGIHPRFHKTARYMQAFVPLSYFHFYKFPLPSVERVRWQKASERR